MSSVYGYVSCAIWGNRPFRAKSGGSRAQSALQHGAAVRQLSRKQRLRKFMIDIDFQDQTARFCTRRTITPTRADERANDREVHTIKVRGGRSGRCVVKAVELTSGGLRGVLESGLDEPQGALIAAQESAAGIVGRRRLKAQTERSGK
jgi:hypothetical protein